MVLWVSAPQMGSIIEFSPTLIAQTPIPPTPSSIRADVLAEVAAIRALLETERDDIAAKIDEMKLEFTLARIDAQREIGESRSEARSEIAEALRDADTAWQKSYDEARTGLSEARNGMVESLAAIKALAIAIKNAMHEEDLAATERARQARAEVLADHDAVLEVLQATHEGLAKEKAAAVAKLATALTERLTKWDKFKKEYKAALEQLLAQYLDAKAFAAWQAAKNSDNITGSRDFYDFDNDSLQNEIDRLAYENEIYGQQVLTAFAEVLPGTGTIIDGFKAITGTDIYGNGIGNGDRAVSILSAVLSLTVLGAVDEIGEGFVDGARAGRHARAGRNMENIANLADDVSDVGRTVRRAGDQASGSLDDFARTGRRIGDGGGCFRPGTVVHKITGDELAIAALLNAVEDQDEASSVPWWIFAALSVGVVLTALHLERKRQQQRMAGPVELASSALDELFTSDTPWEPPLWKQKGRELSLS